MRKLLKCGAAMVAGVMAFVSFAQEGAEVPATEGAEAAVVAEGGEAAATEGGEAASTDSKELQAARTRIDAAAKDPKVMESVMKTLNAKDQITFVAEVNAAIADMTGSAEEKSVMAVNTTKAALRAATAGNTANVLAEVFATAPVETLGAISESVGEDLKRSSDNTASGMNNADYAKVAEAVVKKIAERSQDSSDSDVRSAFGVAMMTKASEVSASEVGAMVDTLSTAAGIQSEQVVEDVKSDITAAAETGTQSNYETLISNADTTTSVSSETSTATAESAAPAVTLVLSFTGPQQVDALVSDIAASVTVDGKTSTPILDNAYGGTADTQMYNNTSTTPATTSDTAEVTPGDNNTETGGAPWSPTGYVGQEL